VKSTNIKYKVLCQDKLALETSITHVRQLEQCDLIHGQE